MDPKIAGLFGNFPDDPTIGLKEVQAYFDDPKHDTKNLVAGLYDLLGYGLKIVFGDPPPMPTNPVIVVDAVMRLHKSITDNPVPLQKLVLPTWVIPILTYVLQAVLVWLAGQAVTKAFAKYGNLATP